MSNNLRKRSNIWKGTTVLMKRTYLLNKGKDFKEIKLAPEMSKYIYQNQHNYCLYDTKIGNQKVTNIFSNLNNEDFEQHFYYCQNLKW